MRDLTTRLREIVQRERHTTRTGSGLPAEPYVVDIAWEDANTPASAESAESIGGQVFEANGSRCLSIDRRWEPDDYYGRRRVAAYELDSAAPIAVLDPRLAETTNWADRVVFFDLETTGLSGGAGTLAFLAGCAWFEPGAGFLVRQFLLTSPSGERAMLAALTEIFDEATLLVTFNGRTFDVPLIEMRWAFHRLQNSSEDVPHFDMLPTSRRLWRTRAVDCSLSSLEREVVGFHRLGDVAGFEIPARYFHFLRTGDASVMAAVLEHNRHDLVSLAALTSRALTLAADGPEGADDPGERLALGRLYEHGGQIDRAARAYELAAVSDTPLIRRHALARLAVLRRRESRHDEAAAAWAGVLECGDAGLNAREDETASVLERQAVEALAIHHEHRARDLDRARRFALQLHGRATGRSAAEAQHRLARLDRKLESASKAKGGPQAALWHDLDSD